MHRIDLNCDLGELPGDAGLALDTAILPYLSSANVACGFHAGDETRIRQMAILCREHRVALGAHPGYRDRAGFGRTVIPMSPQQVSEIVAEQIALVTHIAASEGVHLSHVKPHGALYNLAMHDMGVAAAIAGAVRVQAPDARLVGLAGGLLLGAGRSANLHTTSEVFADRNYLANGQLVPREQPGAMLSNPQQIAERVVAMIQTCEVITVTGAAIPILAETVCVHGDTQRSLHIVIMLRAMLETRHIVVAAPEDTL